MRLVAYKDGDLPIELVEIDEKRDIYLGTYECSKYFMSVTRIGLFYEFDGSKEMSLFPYMKMSEMELLEDLALCEKLSEEGKNIMSQYKIIMIPT